MSGISELLSAGAARQAAGRLAEAQALFQNAAQQAPAEPAGWIALANLLLVARQPEAALAACEAGLARAGGAGLLSAKARVLQSLSRVAEASALYREALAADPANADARLGLALQAAEAGAWDEAEALARPLAGSGSAAVGWLTARVAQGRGDPAAAEFAARRALDTSGLAPDQRAEMELLLGEALDGQGRPAEAFAAFARGKAALRALYAERAAGRESELDRLMRLAAWFEAVDPTPWRAAPPGPPPSAERPGHAFLVGFPRSGTTLLEQALAGHPRLTALEEAPTLAAPAAEFMATPQGLARLARLTPAEAAHWRAHYWREVDARCPEARGRMFLDKAPAATQDLPLIARLFPDAVILFAIRDPRDVVLSCFRNGFQMNALTYAFTDLVETARVYAATMALADVYRRVLPVQPAEVRYERLVGDFAGELARVARALELGVVPRMMDVAATARRRTVRTPSAAQVREGLNQRGVGRWRAYAAELAPVLPILATWVERYGSPAQ